MNTQLYNTLVRAKNFLITVEKNEEDLKWRRDRIFVTNTNPYVLTPGEMPKEFNWGIFIMLLMFVGPFAFIYSFYIYNHNRKAKKKQKHLDELINSEENIKRTRENEKSVEEQKRELKIKEVEYKKYYSDNYWSCLNFLDEDERTFKTVEDIIRLRKYIDGLLNYVKNGVDTLEKARRYYGDELRELAAIEERREREELLERRHKEEIAALNTIARNQERTNDELDRLYKDTFLRRR
ncbi:MAG: hypothetical protein IJZ16_07520 [Clostridia bacterium]|nr:hypothetical protein [Clostridia bacterium]